ncbi:MAG: ribosome-associated translation inhibitor RaiA [Fimbriimonadaceae bacterium]
MEVLVRNAEGNVSTQDREYAAKKLGRLDRFFHAAHKVEMVHRADKLGHRIEITVFADGFTVRGEEHDASLQAAIDKVSDKLETRLKKLKTRIVDSHRKRGTTKLPPALEEPHEEEEHHIVIKERKTFLLKPMMPDEAALQLEMVDHPFFIFRNEENNRISVLYRRKDSKYGLIEPEP